MNDILEKMSQKREKAEKRNAGQNFLTGGILRKKLKSKSEATIVLRRERQMQKIRDQTARMVAKKCGACSMLPRRVAAGSSSDAV